MKATELLQGWPDRGSEREAAILQAVANGHCLPIEWRPVTVERHGHQARFWIAQDALRVGDEDDSVRVNVTAMTAQRLADRLGASLPTTLMLDEVARQYTVQAEPCIQPPGRDSRLKAGLSPHMDDLGAMVLHSHRVDKVVKALAKPPFVICNVGKHWVLSNRLTSKPNAAANYGWYSKSAPYLSASGMRMWQTLGTAHNTSHTDYSQIFQPVRNVVELDGVVLPLAEVLAHPEFWVALSDEGPLKVTRVPGVPTDDSPPPSNVSQTFPPEELPTTPDLPEHLVSLYLEARNYTKADRSKEIRLIVLHTAEIAETLTSAEALARWCNGSGAPRASWHYCLIPSTRVLTSDLNWCPIGDLQRGDTLLGTQEGNQGRASRSLLETKVTAVGRRVTPCVRVDLSDGRFVVCSVDHKWLGMNSKRKVFNWAGSYHWVPAEGLSTGDALCAPLTPWDDGTDYEWGYVGGVFDGEGCWHTASTAQIEFSQKDLVVLHKMHKILSKKGVEFNVQSRANGVNITLISGLQSTLRLLALARPERLLVGEKRYLGRSLRSRSYDNKVFVEGISPVGPMEVVSIETDAHTFFAEGLVSHNCVDADSITQSVKEEYVAWHAPGANRVGIGIEMCGRAAQTPEQWDDDFSRSVLRRTARLTAALCRRWNLPVQFVDAAALKYNVRGITTHAEVTKAFKQSTHTDPGKHFPMDEFLRLVREQ